MKTVSKNWIFKNLKLFNQNDAKVKPIVQSIIRDFQHNGDKALLKYVKKFENSRPSASRPDQFFLTVGQNYFGNKIPFLNICQSHV